ncbi:MAG: hypothetical protein RI894_1467 [Bacteroidota bacterium]
MTLTANSNNRFLLQLVAFLFRLFGEPIRIEETEQQGETLERLEDAAMLRFMNEADRSQKVPLDNILSVLRKDNNASVSQ